MKNDFNNRTGMNFGNHSYSKTDPEADADVDMFKKQNNSMLSD